MTLVQQRDVDWERFAAQWWDRSPVLFTAPDPVPFHLDEVFRSAVACAQRPGAQDTTFTVGRRVLVEPAAYLPAHSDTGFDEYDQRLATQLDGASYALVSHYFHTAHRPQWVRQTAFYQGLWDQVGLPISGAITALFHGTYDHSPVGVHMDRFATFMFALRGAKRMRFWPSRPWTEPVSTKTDYAQYLSDSFTVDVEPGQLLYWPSSYYHVGETLGGGPATSVNVGVPRNEHRTSYELTSLFARLAAVDPAPGSLSEAAQRVRDAVAAGALDDVASRLRRIGAFQPEPPEVAAS